jgi:hypothetical protein
VYEVPYRACARRIRCESRGAALIVPLGDEQGGALGDGEHEKRMVIAITVSVREPWDGRAYHI